MSQKNSNVIQHDFKSYVKTEKKEPLILPLTIQQVSQLMNESKYIVQNWIRDLRDYVPISKNQSGYNVFYEDGIKALFVIKSLHRDKGYSIKQIDQYFKTNGEWFESAPEIPNFVVSDSKEQQKKGKVPKEQQVGLVVPLFDDNETAIKQESVIQEPLPNEVEIQDTQETQESPDPNKIVETETFKEPEQVKLSPIENINVSIDSSSLVNSINHLQKSIDELNHMMGIYIQQPTQSTSEPTYIPKPEHVQNDSMTEQPVSNDQNVPSENDIFVPRGLTRKKIHKKTWKEILLKYIFFWFRWLG